MLNFEFTEETRKALNHERFHHPHPRVRRKMSVLYLKSQGLSHKEIKRIECICENTLLHYLRDYQNGGIEALKEVRFYKPMSELEAHRNTILQYFKDHPPATLNEASAKIEMLTGIKKRREAVRVFLKSMGLSPHKVGMIPAKADVQKQETFLREELEPRIAEAKAGNCTLFL